MTAMVQEFDGVRELSMEEVDAVAGGVLPIVAGIAGRAIVRCAASSGCRTAVRAGVVAAAAGAGALVGYEANRVE